MSNTEMATPSAAKARKLLITYAVGFVAALVLILISYALATHSVTRHEAMTFFSLGILLVLQVIVQVVFFFRLGIQTASDQWHLWVFLFTLLIMLIVVSGNLWIMYNLNDHMMG